MKRVVKFTLATMAILVCGFLAFQVFAVAAFSGMFDKNFTHEELIENYYKHEEDFEDVYRLIQPLTINHPNLSIFFSNAGKDKVNFTAYSGKVHNSQKEHWGGDNLAIESAEIQALLAKLEFTREDLEKLRDAFGNTGCISLHLHLGKINLQYGNSGRNSAQYHLHPYPIVGGTYGRPIGKEGFASQVMVDISVGDATTL